MIDPCVDQQVGRALGLFPADGGEIGVGCTRSVLHVFGPSVADDDPLIEKGVLDSFGMITLVVLLEQKFSIKVNPEDVTQDDFYTVESIARYIEGKVGGGAGS